MSSRSAGSKRLFPIRPGTELECAGTPVSRVRKRLQSAETGVQIETVRGIGYLLRTGLMKSWNPSLIGIVARASSPSHCSP